MINKILKTLSKLCFSIILSLFTLSGALAINGCGDSTNNKIVDVSNIQYAIKNASNDEYVKDGDKLSAGYEYMMEVDIEFALNCNTDGASVIIDGLFQIYNANILDGKVAEANTATVSELLFTDDSSADDCKKTILSFVAPAKAGTVKHMIIKIRLIPKFKDVDFENAKETSDCRASLSVAMHDSNSNFKIDGKDGDGKTFTVRVVRTQLESPKISNDEVGIVWQHISNAIRYDVYVGSKKIDQISATGIEIGERITYTGSQLDSMLALAGYEDSDYTLYIRAVGDVSYIASQSNEITYQYITWE